MMVDENLERVQVERTKEEFDETNRNPKHNHKETHGLRDDIDEETSIGDVKAPDVFERAKEEIDAIVQAFHPKKEHNNNNHNNQAENHGSSYTNGENRHSASNEKSKSPGSDSHSQKNRKSPNLIEKAKEAIETILHKKRPAHRHHKETHGKSDEIDETTAINEVKGPNVFERAKEEFEALLDAIHPKKDSGNAKTPAKKEGGFRVSTGKALEKICSPQSHNKD